MKIDKLTLNGKIEMFCKELESEDPKEFDETELETEKYDERVKQIDREMLFVMSQVKA